LNIERLFSQRFTGLSSQKPVSRLSFRSIIIESGFSLFFWFAPLSTSGDDGAFDLSLTVLSVRHGLR